MITCPPQADLESPTISDAVTRQGVILGTAAYMSPEQAKGKSIDKRADIWAFGVVLFEMLTGKRLFTGETVTETLAAVIKGEPEWTSLPMELHPRVSFSIERCLEKDPENRYSSTSDARVDIRKVMENSDSIRLEPVTVAKQGTNLKTVLPWVTAAIILTAVAAGFMFRKMNPPQHHDIVRLEHILPKGQKFNVPSSTLMRLGHTLAVSPDGKKIVYSTRDGLFLRSLDRTDAALIPGTGENPQSPFFSPDGEWIGYWTQKNNKLKKIPVRGGSPVDLCDVGWIHGAQWCENDMIIYAAPIRGIMRVSAKGGTPEMLTGPGCIRPQLLPDGKSLLFTDISKSPWMIAIKNLESGDIKDLLPGLAAQLLPTGHLVYQTQGSNVLTAVPFDPVKLEVKGTHVPIVSGVSLCSISDSGTLAYIPAIPVTPTSPTASKRILVWVDRNGKEIPLNAPPDTYRWPKISPDGTKVALTISGNNPDIYIWDLVHENMNRLTFHESADLCSLWTPDSKKIVFTSNRDNGYCIFWKASDGTGEEENIASSQNGRLTPRCWANDGKTLIVEEGNESGNMAFISQVSIGDKNSLKPLIKEKYITNHPSISPDGKYMAYAAVESGMLGIYVCPFPGVETGKWQISTGEASESPLWSPDGTELFYLNGESFMAVPVNTKSGFSHGKPRALFKQIYIAGYMESIPYDIHPDGKRFLMMRTTGSTVESVEQIPQKINIVLNWFEELKEKVPTD